MNAQLACLANASLAILFIAQVTVDMQHKLLHACLERDHPERRCTFQQLEQEWIEDVQRVLPIQPAQPRLSLSDRPATALEVSGVAANTVSAPGKEYATMPSGLLEGELRRGERHFIEWCLDTGAEGVVLGVAGCNHDGNEEEEALGGDETELGYGRFDFVVEPDTDCVWNYGSAIEVNSGLWIVRHGASILCS